MNCPQKLDKLQGSSPESWRLQREAKIRNVRVATVHRVPKKESTVVIFDPVCGSPPFLRTDEARRLLTVAFSRAKGKLILVGSQNDMPHPLLAQVYEGSLEEQIGQLLGADTGIVARLEGRQYVAGLNVTDRIALCQSMCHSVAKYLPRSLQSPLGNIQRSTL